MRLNIAAERLDFYYDDRRTRWSVTLRRTEINKRHLAGDGWPSDRDHVTTANRERVRSEIKYARTARVRDSRIRLSRRRDRTVMNRSHAAHRFVEVQRAAAAADSRHSSSESVSPLQSCISKPMPATISSFFFDRALKPSGDRQGAASDSSAASPLTITSSQSPF